MLREEDNKKGFQRTPAFIQAVVQDALEVLKSGRDLQEVVGSHQPRGGTTDVGQHTGGIPRDTSWPLVKQVFQVSSAATIVGRVV
jgi:hypothetical protein